LSGRATARRIARVPAAPIGIVLVDMPKLLRDLLEHTLAAEPDMVVLATEPEVDALADAARETDADVVIVGLEDGELPVQARELLAGHDRTMVVGVEAVDGEAVLYELRPERTSIGTATPTALATAIRTTVEAR
jgi:hypothetical protein